MSRGRSAPVVRLDSPRFIVYNLAPQRGTDGIENTMILSKYNLIYLHVPRTGGNSIESALLPFSDDRPVVTAGQDGKNRFELYGKWTRSKHAMLQHYYYTLGDKVFDYKIAIGVRHPVARSVSYYFAPARWVRAKRLPWFDVGITYRAKPRWDEDAFFETIQNQLRPSSEFLYVNGRLVEPHYVIRYESISEDFERMCRDLGIPCRSSDLPHVNRSAAPGDIRDRILGDSRIVERIKNIYALDMKLFSYT